MASEYQKLLDEIGWKLLLALQEDARLSFAELGRRVGLSLPAVAERVRRLEEAGLITGYHAKLDPHKLGASVAAFIRLRSTGDRYRQVQALARELPEVLECHHLTGGDAFIMKVVVSSIAHLEKLIGRLTPYGQTTTSIVLSSPVVKPGLGRPLVEEE
jgi:Lrp/AsnC family leucine-responsive transcriptional regulator